MNSSALTYPEFEVIVDRRCQSTGIDALAKEWQLESREFFYRRTLETAPVRRIFSSLRDARLMVVEKEPDHRSDALNCGVNLARYRFVAVVPPGVTFDQRRSCCVPWRRRCATRFDCRRRAATSSGCPATGKRGRSRGTFPAAAFHPLADVHAAVLGTPAHGLGPEEASSSGGATRCCRRTDFRRCGRRRSGHDVPASAQGRRRGRASCATRTRSARPARLRREEARAAAGRRQRAALEMLGILGSGRRQVGRHQGVCVFPRVGADHPVAQFWVVVATLVARPLAGLRGPTAILAVLLLSFGTAVVSAAALLLRGCPSGFARPRRTRGSAAARAAGSARLPTRPHHGRASPRRSFPVLRHAGLRHDCPSIDPTSRQF